MGDNNNKKPQQMAQIPCDIFTTVWCFDSSNKVDTQSDTSIRYVYFDSTMKYDPYSDKN